MRGERSPARAGDPAGARRAAGRARATRDHAGTRAWPFAGIVVGLVVAQLARGLLQAVLFQTQVTDVAAAATTGGAAAGRRRTGLSRAGAARGARRAGRRAARATEPGAFRSCTFRSGSGTLRADEERRRVRALPHSVQRVRGRQRTSGAAESQARGKGAGAPRSRRCARRTPGSRRGPSCCAATPPRSKSVARETLGLARPDEIVVTRRALAPSPGVPLAVDAQLIHDLHHARRFLRQLHRAIVLGDRSTPCRAA